MKSYSISEEQRQQLLNHLAARPYHEVFQVIALLANLPEVAAAPAASELAAAPSEAPAAK